MAVGRSSSSEWRPDVKTGRWVELVVEDSHEVLAVAVPEAVSCVGHTADIETQAG